MAHRRRATKDYVRFDVHAVLVPDADNPYDPNAVEVRIDGILVGYLSRADAANYRPGLLRVMQANGRPAYRAARCDLRRST